MSARDAMPMAKLTDVISNDYCMRILVDCTRMRFRKKNCISLREYMKQQEMGNVADVKMANFQM